VGNGVGAAEAPGGRGGVSGREGRGGAKGGPPPAADARRHDEGAFEPVQEITPPLLAQGGPDAYGSEPQRVPAEDGKGESTKRGKLELTRERARLELNRGQDEGRVHRAPPGPPRPFPSPAARPRPSSCCRPPCPCP